MWGSLNGRLMRLDFISQTVLGKKNDMTHILERPVWDRVGGVWDKAKPGGPDS